MIIRKIIHSHRKTATYIVYCTARSFRRSLVHILRSFKPHYNARCVYYAPIAEADSIMWSRRGVAHARTRVALGDGNEKNAFMTTNPLSHFKSENGFSRRFELERPSSTTTRTRHPSSERAAQGLRRDIEKRTVSNSIAWKTSASDTFRFNRTGERPDRGFHRYRVSMLRKGWTVHRRLFGDHRLFARVIPYRPRKNRRNDCYTIISLLV